MSAARLDSRSDVAILYSSRAFIRCTDASSSGQSASVLVFRRLCHAAHEHTNIKQECSLVTLIACDFMLCQSESNFLPWRDKMRSAASLKGLNLCHPRCGGAWRKCITSKLSSSERVRLDSHQNVRLSRSAVADLSASSIRDDLAAIRKTRRASCPKRIKPTEKKPHFV